LTPQVEVIDTSISAATREWLPKARVARNAGYAEAVYLLPYGGCLPLALVASTPEYEWLTLKHGKPSPPKPEPVG